MPLFLLSFIQSFFPKKNSLTTEDYKSFSLEIHKSNHENGKSSIIVLLFIHIFIVYLDYRKFESGLWDILPGLRTIFILHVILIIGLLFSYFIIYISNKYEHATFLYIISSYLVYCFIHLWSSIYSMIDFYSFRDISVYIMATACLPNVFLFPPWKQFFLSLGIHLFFIQFLIHFNQNNLPLEGVITNSTVTLIASRVIFISRYKSKLNDKIANIAISKKNKRIAEQYKIINRDLNLAKQIQLNTHPTKEHLNQKLIDIDVLFEPLDIVSGDYYDYFFKHDNTLRLFIADATGHGVQAGLITMVIKTEYEKLKNEISNPGKLLSQLNENYIKTMGVFNGIFTCFIIDINFKSKRIQYSSSAHPSQLLLLDGKVQEMSSLNRLMGHSSNLPNQSCEFSFINQIQLFLFTDGLTEIYKPEVIQLKFNEIQQYFMFNSNQNSSTTILNIKSQILEKYKMTKFSDDLTMICMKSI